MARKTGPAMAKGTTKGAAKGAAKGTTKPAAKRPSKSTTPTPETLGALPSDTLIRLILDEAGANPAFKKRVSAAIAGTRGPEAVAAIVGRRLSALEKARGYIDWEKIRAFAADLRASLAVIVVELKPLDPGMALDRLHRFLAGADGVLDRVDDSSGRIYAVYESAAEEAVLLAKALPPAEIGAFAEGLVPALDRDGFGLVEQVLTNLLPMLPPDALAALDARFVERLGTLPEPAPPKAGAFRPYDEAESQARIKRRVLDRLRKALADARGDVDAFVALEQADPSHRADTLAIAERLLAAGRAQEALDWVRKSAAPRSLGAHGGMDEDPFDVVPPDRRRRHEVETSILEALGRSEEAQALRWARFEQVLDPQALRDHLARLPDFEDEEALERALAHALAFKNPLAALAFLVRWPRLDLAARLVTERRAAWDGRHWEWLSPAAEALAEEHPLPASLLYRALLDDILGRARSQAYGHGARHLAALDALASRLAPGDLDPDPATYRAVLRKAHGRKIGFWSLVNG